jgi:hypothetical protein
MSVDVVFQPLMPSFAIVSGTPLNSVGAQQACVETFRVVNTTAASAATRFSWGPTVASTAVPAAPGPNNMYLLPNEALYVKIPCGSFFNVAAAGTIEVTPGVGGVGG